jgi:acyl transferase domain-containing protein/phosphopantetheinyl transferase
MSTGTPDDIAIIGMAATFAGARDVATYWSNILGKVEAIREAPENWIGDAAIYDPDCIPDSNRIYTRLGGFLGELAVFDPRPFGTMPVALSGSEPDQFLAMQASSDALADAGYANRDFDRRRTGIILGHGVHPHRANVNGMQHCLAIGQTMGLLRSVFPTLSDEHFAEIEAMLRSKLPQFNIDTIPGLVPNMMTGRICNRLDLMGPNYIVDGACASSVLAVDAAITELRRGRADMMLAGGINTSTSVLVQIIFCKIGALSRRGKVRPFDGRADGTLLGEGQGVVVLKRLEDALRDGDRIYAVIKGIGTASDGRAMGLMAPRFEGEQLAMQRAYAACGIDPATIGLVEAHATGIPLGDEIELRALTSVLGERRGAAPHVALGSVKSMIGHTIPAAGMASLIKMALALHHKVLPPTLADECNPAYGFERTPFFLNIETLPWVQPGALPRRAALDAFGFGGINTHMILEEAPTTAGVPTAAFGWRRRPAPELFVLAAPTREALVASVVDLAGRAQLHEGELWALAADAATKHAAGAFRLAVVADDTASLREKLLGVVDRLARPDTHRLRTRRNVFFCNEPVGGKVAFLFPGENSQSTNLLRELALASPLVRGWFDWLEGVFQGEREIPHRLVLFPPVLGPTEAERKGLEEQLRQVDYGSEAVFTADMALFSLLRALGVRPDCMVGHSTGENAALFASGMLKVTPESLTEIVRRMNAVFREVHASGSVPTGTLITVGAIGRDAVDAALREHPELHLTMDNCPNQVILFGPPPLMERVRGELAAKGAVCTELPMSWAYHTPFVAPMADAFAEILHGGLFATPSAQIYSCATAGPFPEDPDGIRSVMHAQYVSRVRFTETVQRLYQDGVRVFVEVGPGGVLTGFVGDILRDEPHLALAADSRRAPGLEHFYGVLGQLFVNQAPIDLAPLRATRGAAGPVRGIPPILESALPFVRLNDDEITRVRAMLAPAPSAPPTAPYSLSLEADLERNDTEFGFDGSGAVPVSVSSWRGYVPLPFPATIQMVSLDNPSDEAFDSAWFRQHLGAGDIAYFDSDIKQLGKLRRRDWLVGRIAARRAVSIWLADNGRSQYEPELVYDTAGRPMLVDETALSVYLSVSHKDGIGVAVTSDRRVGVDLERLTAVRDPHLLMQTAFSLDEQRLLRDAGWDHSELIAIAWSAKEAAAKSVGRKLLGQETSLAITNIDTETMTIRLAHARGETYAYYGLDGHYVCVVAADA